MANEPSSENLAGRISALEIIISMMELGDAARDPHFDPRAFAAERAERWRQMGDALDDDGSDYDVGRVETFKRMGDLLKSMAETVAEEMAKKASE